MNWTLKTLWLIPTLPLLAAGVSALAKQRQRKFAAAVAIGSMSFSLVLACFAFIGTTQNSSGGSVPRQVFNFHWLQIGDSWLSLGWVLDPLNVVMLVMVCLVGLLIFIYSTGYMSHDENFTRFFCFLSLFAAAMLGLVIANSLLLLFICWELVGLTSYLLIGFWYHKPAATAAAKKAFITTRVGDLALLLGMVWLYAKSGTLLFYDNGNGALEPSAMLGLTEVKMGVMTATGIALLIFAGAVGKSGQVPLHVWLPDAMEGPTPVSALIHAATMVAAGVFLVARVYPLMALSPADGGIVAIERAAEIRSRSQTPLVPDLARLNEGVRIKPTAIAKPATGEVEDRGHSAVSTALTVVTWVGALTALFAASIAVAQDDIKRILAYSTVSQLGFMMMGLGVGGVAVGMFHLITHAFFKALLFMGAGSIIHGCHDEQNVRCMGGLRQFMPVTFGTYAIGMMALSGVPIFFSGFWSKDEILHAAHAWSVSYWPFYLALLAALLTAFYMTRQMFYVFFGNCRLALGKTTASEQRTVEHAGLAAKEHPKSELPDEPHESPSTMVTPLVVLAVFCILLGFLGTPMWPWFQFFLNGGQLVWEPGKVAEPGVLWVMSLSTIVCFGGISLGYWLYGRKPVASSEQTDVLQRLWPNLFALLQRKYFIDEVYEWAVVGFNLKWAKFCDWLDRALWNAGVQLLSYLVLGFSWVNRSFDEYVVNLGFDNGCRKLTEGGGLFSKLQSGLAQEYLRFIGIALTVLALLLIWGCGA